MHTKLMFSMVRQRLTGKDIMRQDIYTISQNTATSHIFPLQDHTRLNSENPISSAPAPNISCKTKGGSVNLPLMLSKTLNMRPTSPTKFQYEEIDCWQCYSALEVDLVDFFSRFFLISTAIIAGVT